MAKTIKWDEELAPAQNAGRRLPALVKQYFAGGRAAARGRASTAVMHRFRLRTRRLGYTLELFQSNYGPRLAQRLEALRRVERILEELDDCVAARRVLGKISGTAAETRARKFLAERVRSKVAEFRTCWTEEVDAKGQEQAWREYVARARSR